MHKVCISNPNEATLKVSAAIVLNARDLNNIPGAQKHDVLLQLKAMFAAVRPTPVAGAPHLTKYPEKPAQLPPIIYNHAYRAEGPSLNVRVGNFHMLAATVPARKTCKILLQQQPQQQQQQQQQMLAAFQQALGTFQDSIPGLRVLGRGKVHGLEDQTEQPIDLTQSIDGRLSIQNAFRYQI